MSTALQNMPQKELQHMLEYGATLVFLDVPAGTEFGIDYNSWTVGPNFRGLKMIPPGIHFVYYSAQSSDGTRTSRTGFFHKFNQQEVLIKKWSKQDEDFSVIPVTEEEQDVCMQNKKDMDRFLAPYPHDTYKKWVSLTSYIKPNVLKLLNPECGKIYSVPQFESKASNSQSRKEAAECQNEAGGGDKSTDTDTDADGLPNMKPIPDMRIKFTEIPKKKYPEGSTPAEMSLHNMDHAWLLETILLERFTSHHTLCTFMSDEEREEYEDEDEDATLSEKMLLGELQYAFVVFLIGHLYDGFEQWKKIVNLFCRSESIHRQYVILFEDFIKMMYYQVQEIPADYFVDITDSKDNFLVVNLQQLFMNCDTSMHASLFEKSRKFRMHLEKRYGWEFPAEEDAEDMPVIVDLESSKEMTESESDETSYSEVDHRDMSIPPEDIIPIISSS